MTITESRPRETNTLIENTEVRYLKSAFVDQEFRICIGPGWYQTRGAQPTGKVPVIYVLDGNIEVIGAVRTMHFGGELPPALVVAIGYPLETSGPMRFRDLSPTNDPDMDRRFGGAIRSGGAASFLRFIREELKPFIEANYHADSSDATLVGGSLGGVFAAYALINTTDTFQRYCILSPALSIGNEVIVKQEDQYAASHKDLRAKVFIGAGAREDAAGMAKYMGAAEGPGRDAPKITILEPTEFFARRLANRGYPGLSLRFEVFPKETHGSTGGVAISWGLRSLFGTLDP
jgi:predicted alpha/beta superfamily hydrolase